ncbi:MAG: ZIP family metal transporter [Clostridia bacterium]|nr:ZIP family metal transporter [Clostridia bacterium]MDH7573519.1 ZIP family metal transporter [Clostridia bacterium]
MGEAPVWQALLATLGTWAATAVGAATVLLTGSVPRKFLDGMLGFAAGVMLSASFWSLLVPAVEMAGQLAVPRWFPAAVGLAAGSLFLRLADALFPHLHAGLAENHREGLRTSWQRTTLLVLAVTLHNVPEGLAVGVAFGAAAAGLPEATREGAVALALGVALQNFPEGMAVSLPLRREGVSKGRSFWYGQLSGLVEPVAGVLGATATLAANALLPYVLGFAAGAMVFVVIEELIPSSQEGGHVDVATMGAMVGFIVMMILDLLA